MLVVARMLALTRGRRRIADLDAGSHAGACHVDATRADRDARDDVVRGVACNRLPVTRAVRRPDDVAVRADLLDGDVLGTPGKRRVEAVRDVAARIDVAGAVRVRHGHERVFGRRIRQRPVVERVVNPGCLDTDAGAATAAGRDRGRRRGRGLLAHIETARGATGCRAGGGARRAAPDLDLVSRADELERAREVALVGVPGTAALVVQRRVATHRQRVLLHDRRAGALHEEVVARVRRAVAQRSAPAADLDVGLGDVGVAGGRRTESARDVDVVRGDPDAGAGRPGGAATDAGVRRNRAAERAAQQRVVLGLEVDAVVRPVVVDDTHRRPVGGQVRPCRKVVRAVRAGVRVGRGRSGVGLTCRRVVLARDRRTRGRDGPQRVGHLHHRRRAVVVPTRIDAQHCLGRAEPRHAESTARVGDGTVDNAEHAIGDRTGVRGVPRVQHVRQLRLDDPERRSVKAERVRRAEERNGRACRIRQPRKVEHAARRRQAPAVRGDVERVADAPQRACQVADRRRVRVGRTWYWECTRERSGDRVLQRRLGVCSEQRELIRGIPSRVREIAHFDDEDAQRVRLLVDVCVDGRVQRSRRARGGAPPERRCERRGEPRAIGTGGPSTRVHLVAGDKELRVPRRVVRDGGGAVRRDRGVVTRQGDRRRIRRDSLPDVARAVLELERRARQLERRGPAVRPGEVEADDGVLATDERRVAGRPTDALVDTGITDDRRDDARPATRCREPGRHEHDGAHDARRTQEHKETPQLHVLSPGPKNVRGPT